MDNFSTYPSVFVIQKIFLLCGDVVILKKPRNSSFRKVMMIYSILSLSVYDIWEQRQKVVNLLSRAGLLAFTRSLPTPISMESVAFSQYQIRCPTGGVDGL